MWRMPWPSSRRTKRHSSTGRRSWSTAARASTCRARRRPFRSSVSPSALPAGLLCARASVSTGRHVEAVLRPYHRRVRAELERHGGTVEKFIGDAVMALFGAPVAHEDDPERAVRAALAIRDFAVEDGLELRIGITTGEALISLDAR